MTYSRTVTHSPLTLGTTLCLRKDLNLRALTGEVGRNLLNLMCACSVSEGNQASECLSYFNEASGPFAYLIDVVHP